MLEDGIKTRDVLNLWDQPGGHPLTGQVVSGVKAARARSAASARNMGKQNTDTARAYPETVRKGEREHADSGNWRH
jgi:hypothetical protein